MDCYPPSCQAIPHFELPYNCHMDPRHHQHVCRKVLPQINTDQ